MTQPHMPDQERTCPTVLELPNIPYGTLTMFWQHPSLAPEVQKLNLSHPGFEPEAFPLREQAANQLSQSEFDCRDSDEDF